MVRFIMERFTKKMTFVYYALSTLFMGTNPLILKEFVIPPKLVVGSTVTLSCVLDLDGGVLQSIKWYKDGAELCRYGPYGDGQLVTHRLMDVEVLKCGNMSIQFAPISVTARGTYKCEASSIPQLSTSTKPCVQTVMGSRNLSVFAYPMDAPIISGLKTHYHAGEFMEAQCSAPPSYPAPEMSWSINGKGVDTFKTNMKVHEDKGLLRATLSVKLMADAGLFTNQGGYALFVCTSVLMDTPPMTAEAKVYWSTEPTSTETDVDMESSGDNLKNSQEKDNYSLKDEPPDEHREQGTDAPNPVNEEKSRNVGEDSLGSVDDGRMGSLRRANRGSPSGSREGYHVIIIFLGAIFILQGHFIHCLKAIRG